MEDPPLDDLLKRLEGSLVKLLESVRGDPWSLLIFQTLLWSFRRWAIHYLISDDTSDNMHDYLWDSHIDLVKNYAPEGLQEFGVVWLSPANVGDRVDSLEELNAYFLFIVDKLNKAIDTNNENDQNYLSIFLDETITDILAEWLEGRTEYRIYPGHDDSPDFFPTERIFGIMQKILEKNLSPRKTIPLPATGEPAAELKQLHDPVISPPVEVVASPPEIVIEAPVLAPVPVPVEVPVPTPLHVTIAAAIARRRTLRLHGRRADSNRTASGATRKRRITP